MTYQYFFLDINNFVAHVRFNNADKANALPLAAWHELRHLFEALDQDTEVRVVVLSGEGKHFCSGIDISVFTKLVELTKSNCQARTNEKLRRFILDLQSCVTAIENCSKPVLAAIHGSCIGGGLDIATACDMRYATDNAIFCVKEIDFGIVADLGTLQRLPRLVSMGVAKEMAFSGATYTGKSLVNCGLVNAAFATAEEMLQATLQEAATIAEKSPLTIRGIKQVLAYSVDHSIADGLNYVATWNSAMMLSNDMQETMQALFAKRKPKFEEN